VSVLLKESLTRQASALGFDCIGVTGPDAIAEAGRHFREFLDAGAHGDMDWLAANPERRTDPRVLWSGVRSVIMLGVNYGPDENPLAILAQRTRGAISVYAQGDDYHDLIKKRLKALARWLVAASGCEVKVFVDTAAVMKHLDLVISVDTALAHLAGALAVPVWVAMPLAPDWRWLLDREDTPWYPTMRLFRQQKLADWPQAISRIADALQILSHSTTTPTLKLEIAIN